MSTDPEGDCCQIVTNFVGGRACLIISEEDLDLLTKEFESFGAEFPAVSPNQPDEHKEDGFCYWNARRLAESMSSDLLYVDGFAGQFLGDRVGPDGNTYPTYELEHHAWCIDRIARVVDPSWDPMGKVYWGVPLPWTYVEASLSEKDAGGELTHQSYLPEWNAAAPEDRAELYEEFRTWAGLK